MKIQLINQTALADPAFIGWTYDNDTKKFTSPVEEPTND